MNAAGFALLMLAAGFVFLRHSSLTRNAIRRMEGHSLYFLVVSAAAGVFALSALCLHELGKIPFFSVYIKDNLINILMHFGATEEMIPYGSVCMVALPFAIVAAKLLNLPLLYSSSLRKS